MPTLQVCIAAGDVERCVGFRKLITGHRAGSVGHEMRLSTYCIRLTDSRKIQLLVILIPHLLLLGQKALWRASDG